MDPDGLAGNGAKSSDEYNVEVTGIDLTGQETLLKSNLKGSVNFRTSALHNTPTCD